LDAVMKQIGFVPNLHRFAHDQPKCPQWVFRPSNHAQAISRYEDQNRHCARGERSITATTACERLVSMRKTSPEYHQMKLR
jgi:hypothetical protein